MANSNLTVTSATITAVNTGTSGINPMGYFNYSISGTFVGTIVLQRSFDLGVTWLTTNIYTSPVESKDTDLEAKVFYRLYCTAYTSGSANLRISF